MHVSLFSVVVAPRNILISFEQHLPRGESSLQRPSVHAPVMSRISSMLWAPSDIAATIVNLLTLLHQQTDSSPGAFKIFSVKSVFIVVPVLSLFVKSYVCQTFLPACDVVIIQRIALNRYPTQMMAVATMLKNTTSSRFFKTFFRIIASGNDNAVTAIIKASTVPIAIPFSIRA